MYAKRGTKRKRSAPRRYFKSSKLRRTDTMDTTATTAVVPRSLVPLGLPKKQVATLRYFETVTLNAGIGVIASNVFRANSLFDPNVAVGGHQPRGFDQWMAFYGKGIVLGSKCTAKCISATSTEVSLFGVVTLTTSVTPLTSQALIEEPRCSWAASGNVNTVNQETFATYSPKILFDYKNPKDEGDLQFTATGDAPQQGYFHVWNAGTTILSDPGPHVFEVVIDYTCLFFEPNALPSS